MLAERGIAYRTIETYRPRTNGEVERVPQTNSYCNERRPHGALSGRSPSARAQHRPGWDTQRPWSSYAWVRSFGTSSMTTRSAMMLITIETAARMNATTAMT